MKELQNDTETKIKTIIDVSKWSVQKFETVSLTLTKLLVHCWKSLQTTKQSYEWIL